jgi:hypothetical protein
MGIIIKREEVSHVINRILCFFVFLPGKQVGGMRASLTVLPYQDQTAGAQIPRGFCLPAPGGSFTDINKAFRVA